MCPRKYTPDSCISRTVWSIVLKFDVWFRSHQLWTFRKSMMENLCMCTLAPSHSISRERPNRLSSTFVNSQGTVIWVRLSLHGMTAQRTCARGGQISFNLCDRRFAGSCRLAFAGGLWEVCGWFAGELRAVCVWRFESGLRAVCRRFACGLRLAVCGRFPCGLRAVCVRLAVCGRFAGGLRAVCVRFAVGGLRAVCEWYAGG